MSEAFFFFEPARQIEHVTGRYKAAQMTKADDNTALVHIGDFAGPQDLFIHELFGAFPIFVLARLSRREDQVAIAIVQIDDGDIDLRIFTSKSAVCMPIRSMSPRMTMPSCFQPMSTISP